MANITRTIVDKEKENLKQDIFNLAVNTAKRINILGSRLRKIKSQVDSEEFTIYIEELPISKKTAYNWMRASERIEAGEQSEKISKLYTLESAPSVKVTQSDVDSQGVTSKKDEKTAEKDDEKETPESNNVDKEPEYNYKYDKNKHVIPEELEYVMIDTVGCFEDWRTRINDIKREMKEQNENDGHDYLDLKIINNRIENVKSALKTAIPHCVCPSCGGDGGCGSVCGDCKGKGWVTVGLYHGITQEIKDMAK